ncbi:putative intramolecular lyase [Streptomyces bingchenggensis BCW-1]|uniref:Putative intramolecular lyase n=1 Tax=Streptomyces bingchenggensis (strain BCW-1) TaxID=749414 RepID=D7C8A6_STRBB|nr:MULTISPECIES: adenylosuccinate lyase family protein [Streptomyces]ADI06295.1 putative intramolecular lyase [Streptomyces bingchenggensis BCW-1]
MTAQDGPTPAVDCGLDSGLLSPVRAGAPAEAATSDEAWLQALLDAEAGLVRAQARLGVVPEDAAAAITRTAQAGRLDLVRLARSSRGAANPVVALVEELTAAVALTDPDSAEYVHRGSTSQDIMDSAAMLVAHRTTGLILADLDRVAAALARLAEDHRDTAMPGRTLALHAVPVTFGLKAAGWLQAVLEAGERLRALRAQLPVQLGGAAGTLAGYLEYARVHPRPDAGDGGGARVAEYSAGYGDRLIAAFAAELGLAEPVLPWHTARAPIARIGSTLAEVTGALGKLAVDVQTLSRTEIAEVAEPAAAGRGVSSAMPHKRNPALATLIRSAALQVPALALVLAQAMLAEDERPAGVWHAEWQPMRECLRLAGGAAHNAVELAEGLSVRPGRMQDNLGMTGSLLITERLAAVLAPVVGKATAKSLMSRAAAETTRTGRPLSAVLLDLPDLNGHFDAAELAELLDPGRYTGAAGELVDRALAHYRETRRPL